MLRPSLTALCLTGAALAAASPAAAVISSPPALPHDVTVFPQRDFVSVTAEPSSAIRVDVLRNGVNVGTATGTTDATGLLEVNHPGGVCWTGFTPDILPGDVVQAVDAADPANGDATTVAPVSVEQGAVVGGTVVIHGNAPTAAGTPVPIGGLEQRVVAPELVALIGKRDVRAPGAGNGWTGAFTYDPVGRLPKSRSADVRDNYAGLRRSFTWIFFSNVKRRSSSRHSSRPKPDCFTPPKGAPRKCRPTSLIQT